jgi:hypothetical protein
MDVSLIRGQSYDGASTMRGVLGGDGGVQAEIKKLSPAASYVHCASHVLNLVTQKGEGIKRNCDTIGTWPRERNR